MTITNKLALKIWDSPTFMTWASLATRSLSLVLILPLILTKLEKPEIALWYLFGAALSFQSLSYMGFGSTFVRIVAYAFGGSKTEDLKDSMIVAEAKREEAPPNWVGIGRILSNMNYIYFYLTFVLLVFILATTLLLNRPINLTADITNSWVSWTVIAVGSIIALRGSIFMTYLEGINQIALVRRWDALFGLFGIASNFIVLIFFGNLISLVISSQFWFLANIPRNYFLCKSVANGVFTTFTLTASFDPSIFAVVWESAWKSIVGTLMSVGVVQFSNLLYAQIGTSAAMASYLLGFNLLKQLSTFSQAPFYSKLPLLARLRKQGKIKELKRIASRGMFLTYWFFLFGAISMGLFGEVILIKLGSNADFPTTLLWSTLALGFLLERFGALHIQLYSTTNHIIWHVANGISGLIYLTIAFVALKSIDVYAFPCALIASNLLFYSWYSAKFSLKSIGETFWSFDKKIFIPALALSLTLISYVLINEFY